MTFHGGRWPPDIVAPPAALGIAGIVAISQRIGDGPLATIGLRSLSIFVMHSLAAAGLRVVMVRAHVPPDPTVYLLTGTVCGVLGPMLAYAMLARWNGLAPLGLAPPLRRRIVEGPGAVR